MTYVRILFLHLQSIFTHRLKSFVYFLIAVFNAAIFLLFWYGSLKGGRVVDGWDLQAMQTYYLFLIITGAMLIAHIEYDIAWLDIHEGGIVKYLIRPFSFALFKLFEETPWRILQGFYGMIVVCCWIFFVGPLRMITAPSEIGLTLCIWILAYTLSFFYKASLALLSFWIEEVWGVFRLSEVLILIFAGFLMPLDLYPAWLYRVSMQLPFASMTYLPVLAISGRLSGLEWLTVIVTQVFWILVFFGSYKLLWHFGVKKFSAVGQ